MIYDHSSNLSGESITRLSDYLSLCKIDVLVRNRVNRPTHRVDQPGIAGQVSTLTVHSNIARSNVYHLVVDHSTTIGNRSFTLQLKDELRKQKGLSLSSLTNAGMVTLQKGNQDIERLPLYEALISDNFANSCKIKRSVCLAFNKQDTWVKQLLILISEQRLQVDYLLVVNQGQIRYYQCRKS